MNTSIGEDKRQEAGQQQSTAQNEQPHVAIKVAQDRDDFPYLLSVFLENRLVEHITDRGANAQLCQVKETKKVSHGARQSHEVCPQLLQKYLAGEERDEQGDKVEEYVDTGIEIAFMETGFGH